MSYVEMIKNKKDNECVVDLLYKICAENECQNCGKCVFGYESVFQLTSIFKDFTEKKARGGDMDLIPELAEYLGSQVLCEEGLKISEAIKLALAEHKAEIEDHANKKGCKAGVCKAYMTYHVLPDKCTGCMECMDVCDEDAIKGKKNFVHVIDLVDCVQCGKCLEACEEGAIVVAGAEKPRGPKAPIPCKRR
ncbi:MAG: 4Fe-4S binding protein [Parasporobacterium sp.]|nr:4Fe-4S binding protein [Parasporobacterium sp.]